MNKKHGLVLGAALALTVAGIAQADPTALDLVKKGDSYVGVQSKDKVLQIFSEESVASLQPNIWHVVYFDPDVTFKSTDVKFGAGQEMEVTHPMHMFPAKAGGILDLSRIHVDSDRALRIAAAQPLLKGLTLRYSKIALSNSDDGVVWKIELWAVKVNDQAKEADIGTVCVSAADGSVVQSICIRPTRVEAGKEER